jgi:hypothetical protein
MAVEVYHLQISKEGREDPEVRSLHFDLISLFSKSESGSTDKEKITAVFSGEHRDSGLFYVKVADVKGDDLDIAFSSTNNIENPWKDNPNVEVPKDFNGPFRSTSIGDVMVLDENVFGVSPLGFTRLQLDLRERPRCHTPQ